MRVMILDTETTGLAADDDLIEVAWAVVTDASGSWRELGRTSSLLATARAIPPAVTGLTGLVAADLVGAPPPAKVLTTLARAMTEVDVVVCWNADFDRGMVLAAASRAGVTLPPRPWRCALAMAREAQPGLERYRLGAVAEALGVPHPAAHRALGDVEATLGIWTRLIPAAPGPSSPSSPSSGTADPRQPVRAPSGARALFL